MTTQDLPLIKATVAKMQWHEQRQKELAKNIANADTPGYQAMDVKPLDFKAMLSNTTSKASLTMAATNSKHLGLGGTSGSSAQHEVKAQKNTYGVAPTGNSVSLEEQLMKMNENFTDHRLTTTIYQKNIDLIKAALKE